jgi:virginiamycin B lyase
VKRHHRPARPRTRYAALAVAGIAALVMLPAAGSASATSAPLFKEYPDPLHVPCESVYDPSRNTIYVEEIASPSVSLNLGTTTVGRVPVSIGLGASVGSVGVLSLATGNITHIPLPVVGSTTFGMAFGPDGNLWFGIGGAVSAVGSLDPATNTITSYSTPTPLATPTDIWPGPDNAMYFLEDVAQKLGRIDLATHVITEYPLPALGLEPTTAIIMPGTGPDMMFSTSLTNSITVFNTTTHTFTEHVAPTPLALTQGSTIGPDGAIWFSETLGQKIARIDPGTGAIAEYPISTLGNLLPEPGPLVRGSDGNLWSADGGLTGGDTIGRFNTTTHRITYFTTPTVASGPCDIDPVAAGNGLLVIGEATGGSIAVATEAALDAAQP